MKQSEKAWILELIQKHQKSQSSLIKHFRKDRRSAESWKEDDKDKHMTEWSEEQASKHLRMARIHQHMIEDLALLGDFRIVKFQDELFLQDQILKTRAGTFVRFCAGLQDKARTTHERLMCTRDRI